MLIEKFLISDGSSENEGKTKSVNKTSREL